ncbi:MAG TPA: hypothetical protein VJN29_07490 [Intrasporangium sp.]|nr:hypothetical protein [Intrasporangium sp.]HKX67053.1 hypothetical protein [Intrasporangium sp.]
MAAPIVARMPLGWVIVVHAREPTLVIPRLLGRESAGQHNGSAAPRALAP